MNFDFDSSQPPASEANDEIQRLKDLAEDGLHAAELQARAARHQQHSAQYHHQRAGKTSFIRRHPDQVLYNKLTRGQSERF